MIGSYKDAKSEEAKTKLIAQYGSGLKRYGSVASWHTLLACWFLDLLGISTPQVLKITNHPAQLHYGIWNKKNLFTWDSAIRQASTLAFEVALPQKYKEQSLSLIHFGSGWGGVDIQLAKDNPGLHTLGITIDPSQFSLAVELAKLYKLRKRVKFQLLNFLELVDQKQNTFNMGIAIESLSHVPKSQFDLLWKNIDFVLSPGARFVIHDWYLEAEIKPGLKKKLRIFLKGWDMAHCAYSTEVSKTAKARGFKLTQETDYTKQIIKSANEIYTRARIFKPLIQLFQGSKSKYVKSLGITNQAALEFADTCLIQKELFETGVVKYKQLVFEKTAN